MLLTESRVGRKPIAVPTGVTVDIKDLLATVKGPKGSMNVALHSSVQVLLNDGKLEVKQVKAKGRLSTSDRKTAKSIPGTIRAELNNAVHGVTAGFERKLTLVGVGYRAQMKGKVLALSLGFSHPVEYTAPDGITIEAPSLTEILIKGSDKQLVGHVASKIVAIRPQEPYKGKGVVDPRKPVVRKETKKK